MTWLEVLPTAFAGAVWLLLPGLPITYGLGLRGVAAWAMAPVVSVALVALTAMVAGSLGIAWSVWLVIGVCAVLTVLVGVGAFLLRQRFSVIREADPRPVTVAAVAGLLPALVLGAVTVVRGFGRPDNLSQTYDALFHYNAVALILDTHNGSAMILSNFDSPDSPATFYPAAWHDFASLLVMTTGSSIPVTANLLSALIAVVLWPLSCLFLARQLFGRSAGALAITGVLSIAFGAGPWGLLGFGVLWPNALGLAIVPAGLAVLLSLVGLAKDDALGRGRAALLLPVTAVAAVFAHPGALFTLVVLGVFPAGHALLVRAWRLHKDGRSWRGVGEVLAVVAVLGALWYWTATTPNPAFKGVREQYWAPFETAPRAVGEVLLNATNGRPAQWLLSAVILVGVVASVRVPRQRWLIPAHATTGFLYLVAATLNQPETRKFTGYWYNDSFRLAAVLPVTGVPLAVAGILLLTKKIAERVPSPQIGVTAVAIAAVAVLTAVTQGMYHSERTERLAVPYLRHPPGDILATPGQRDFLTHLKQDIPEGTVVANNPWDGSGMLWALADRRTLFPHFTAPAGTDQRYLAEHLSDAASDPKVCQIANRLHVGYLVIGDSQFWPWDNRKNDYPGFADPGSKAGFRLVDADGKRKLYQLTACASTVGPTS